MAKKTAPKPATDSRAKPVQRFHVAKSDTGEFHVLAVPGYNDKTVSFWGGPFKTERGATLCTEELNTLTDDLADDVLNYQMPANSFFDQFAGVLTFLEKQPGVADPRALAYELVEQQPWLGFTGHNDPSGPWDDDGDDPFGEDYTPPV